MKKEMAQLHYIRNIKIGSSCPCHLLCVFLRLPQFTYRVPTRQKYVSRCCGAADQPESTSKHTWLLSIITIHPSISYTTFYRDSNMYDDDALYS